MAGLSCEICQERAAELALNVLDGRERADVLAHLQDCGRCQALVADLADTAIRLVEELASETDPPAGLEHRVMRSIIPTDPVEEPLASTPHDRSSRERIPVAIAILSMVMLMAGGLIFSVVPRPVGPTGPDASGQVVQHTADMMSAPLILGRQQIGTAYLFTHRPVWVVVSIARADDPSTATLNDQVRCDLVRKDGTTILLGTFALNDGHADWAAGAAVDPATLADARLTVQVGRVMSYASFARPATASGTTPSRPAALAQPATPPASRDADAGPDAPKPAIKQPKDPDPRHPKPHREPDTHRDPIRALEVLAAPHREHEAPTPSPESARTKPETPRPTVERSVPARLSGQRQHVLGQRREDPHRHEERHRGAPGNALGLK